MALDCLTVCKRVGAWVFKFCNGKLVAVCFRFRVVILFLSRGSCNGGHFYIDSSGTHKKPSLRRIVLRTVVTW